VPKRPLLADEGRALSAARSVYRNPVTSHSDMQRLRRLTGVKWGRFGDDVIPAWVADMDFLTAPAVADALHEMIDRGDTGYNFDAHRQLPEAYACWSQERHGWQPDPERVRVFAGVLQPIAAVLATCTEPGDGVVLFTPVYPPFFGMIEKSGRRVIDCPLDPDGWGIDPDRLAHVMDDTVRAVIVCQPHNPTGRIFTARELAPVVRLAEERGLLVISDEIWHDIALDGAVHVPFASVAGQAAKRTVTVTAASKSFNLGGLSCAVAHFGDPAVIDQIDAMPPHLLGMVNSLGAQATLAAWTGGAQWLDSTVQVLAANRDHLAARLARELPSVVFRAPEATYLAWLDFRALGMCEDPAAFLLDHARVALSCGPDFGPQGHGFARLNFATHPEILDAIVDRIAEAVH